MQLTSDLDGSAVSWTGGGGDGNWFNSANWSTHSIPLPFEDVLIDAPGHVIDCAGGVSIDSIVVAAGTTLNITSPLFAMTTAAAKPLENHGTISIGAGADLVVGNANFAGNGINSGLLKINGGALDIVNIAIDNTAGTILVDLNSSLNVQTFNVSQGTITNHGLVKAFAGTVNTVDSLTAFTNTGTVEVADDGTSLLLLNETIDNSGGTVQIDALAGAGPAPVLTLQSTIINHGSVTDSGTLNLSGSATIENGTLLISGQFNVNSASNNIVTETVTNTGAIEVLANGDLVVNAGSIANAGSIEVKSTATLELQGLTLTNTVGGVHGSVTVDSGGILDLESAIIGAGTLAVSGTLNSSGTSALNGVATTNNSGAGDLFEVSGGDLVVNAGSIANAGSIEVKSTATLELQGLTLTNTVGGVHGSVTVDSGGILDLESAIIGAGTLAVSGTLNSSGTSALNGVATTNNSGAGDLFEVSGGDLVVNAGSIANAGSIEVKGTATLELQSLTLTNTVGGVHGSVTVDSGGILDLESAIIGAGTLAVSGTLNSSGTSALNGVATTNNSGAGDLFEVSGGDLVVNAGSIANAGSIEVKSTATLELQSLTLTNTVGGVHGSVTVDSGGILDLESAIIGAGTLAVSGTLNSSGTSALNGVATTNNSGAGDLFEVSGGDLVVNAGSIANAGSIEVKSTATLELQSLTLTNTVGGVHGSVTVDSGGILDLESAIIGAGTLAVSGTLNSSGTSALNGVATTNNSGAGDLFEVSGGDLVVNAGSIANAGSIEVKSTATLELQGLTLTNTVGGVHGSVTVDSGGILDLESAIIGAGTLAVSGTLNSSGTSALNGVATTNNSGAGDLFEVSGGDLVVNAGSIANAGSIEVKGTATLELQGLTLTNTVGGVHGSVTVDNGGILDLESAIIGAGTLSNSGTITVSSNSAINNDVLTNTSVGSIVQVNDGSTLTLNATTIHGGTINDGDQSSLGGMTGGTIHVTGDSQVDSCATMNDGSVDIDGGKVLTLNDVTVTGIAFNNNGTGAINVDGTHYLDLSNVTVAAGSIGNAGTVEVQNGVVVIVGDVFGIGSTIIDGGATLELGGAFSQGLSFAATNAKLQIDATASFSGTITNILAGDSIDLRGIGYGPGTHASYSAGVLTVTGGGNTLALNLPGNFANAIFAGASDNHGGTTVTLTTIDDAPAITTTNGSTAERANKTGDSTDHDQATGTVAFTDIDLTDRPTVTGTYASYAYVDVNNHTLTLTGPEAAAVELGQLGVSVNANSFNNGSSTWTYDVTDNALDFLAQGSTLTLTYDVNAADGKGGVSTTLPVTITITGTNDAPVVAAALAAPANEGDPAFNVDLLSGAGDPDDGETATISVDSASVTYSVDGGNPTGAAPAGVSLSGSTLTVDPSEPSFAHLVSGAQRTITVAYNIVDVHGALVAQTETVTITGTNNVPTLGGVATGDVNEDVAVNNAGQLTTSNALTIVDIDPGQSSFIPQNGTVGDNGYGSFTLLANGTWSYSSNDFQTSIQQLGTGVSVTDSFTAVSSDRTASQLVTVTIHGTNDAFTVGGVSSGTVTEDFAVDAQGNLKASGTLTIVDVDQNQSSFTPQNGTVGIGGYGTFTLTADGAWTYTASDALPAIQRLGRERRLSTRSMPSVATVAPANSSPSPSPAPTMRRW